MLSYAEREIFKPFELLIWEYAAMWVGLISNTYGNELRCHELARVIHWMIYSDRGLTERLYTIDPKIQLWKGSGEPYTVEVVDGHLGIQEHTWIQLKRPYGNFSKIFILDVYASGRQPQVQLIDLGAPGTRDYREGGRRVDVNHDLARRVIAEIEASL